MKKLLTLLISISMLGFGFSGVAFAEAPAESGDVFVLPDGVEIVETETAEEASAAVPAADNEKYYEIDLSSGEVTAGDREIRNGFRKICGESFQDTGIASRSKSKKKRTLQKLTKQNSLYALNNVEGDTAEISATFATCRLLVTGGVPEETFGAISGTSYKGDCVLRYADEASTRDAYEEFCMKYGSENILIDKPLKANDSEWGYQYMGFADVREGLQEYGNGVTVAVLDSGIKGTHEAFAGRTIIMGYDFANDDTDPKDDEGHGTAVSSVITQSTGANVEIMAVKVLDNRGSGSFLDAVYGVQYAAEHHADVINMSFGADLVFDPNSSGEIEVAKEDLAKLDKYLSQFQGPMITSTGNDREDIDKYYTWPSVSEYTIAVSGLEETEGAPVFYASHSNYGESVDYSAPGANIKVADYRTTSSYKEKNGTSFAAPLIAAAAAQVMSNNEELVTKEQVMEGLNAIVVDLSGQGHDKFYGNGCPILSGYPVDTSRLSIRTAVVDAVSDATFTGEPITPTPEVVLGEIALVGGTDIEYVYAKNQNVGKATLTIQGIGAYKGRKIVDYKILPKGSYVKDLKGASKAITVKWKKQSEKMASSRITGYRVQVATDKEFTTGKKTKTITGYKNVSKKITGLKAKKKYYVRVRTYKTVGETKYWSDWSKVKNVKTK